MKKRKDTDPIRQVNVVITIPLEIKDISDRISFWNAWTPVQLSFLYNICLQDKLTVKSKIERRDLYQGKGITPKRHNLFFGAFKDSFLANYGALWDV